MPTDAAHKRKWQIFEVVVGVPFLAGIGLQVAVPVSLPSGCMHPSSSWQALPLSSRA